MAYKRAPICSGVFLVVFFCIAQVTSLAQEVGIGRKPVRSEPTLPHDSFHVTKSRRVETRQASVPRQSLLTLSDLQNSPIFNVPPVYGSGGDDASFVVVADVNGDGKPDLVVADVCMGSSTCANGSVSVLLGNGDGSFQPAVSYNSGGDGAYSVAVGDVNGDGKPDLLVANGNGTVGVLLGNGDGSFQPAVAYSSGGLSAHSVALADVNSDGKPDLIVANTYGSTYANSTVGVLLGNGDGTFNLASTYDTGGLYAYSVAVGDVNGDGKADLLVANWCFDGTCIDGGVGILLGNGDGTFHTTVAYRSGGINASSIAVADVNHDGKADLLVANMCANNGACQSDNGTLGVLLGNGDGTFYAAIPYDTGAFGSSSVVVGDVDGDGNLDLVVANECGSAGSGTSISCANGSVAVLLGNGDGTFQPPATYASAGFTALSVAVADVNSDGKPDLLVTNSSPSGNNNGNGTVSILFGNGNGTFQGAVIYHPGAFQAEAVATGDVNGDGIPDLVIASQCYSSGNCANGGVSVLLGNGDGAFRALETYPSGGSNAYSIAVGDLNGDGKLDLIVANYCISSSNCANGVGVLLGSGDGTFQPAVSYASGGYYAQSVAIADVNGDGKPDLLIANQCLTNSSCINGIVGVLLGNGDGTFQPAISYPSGGMFAFSLAVADVNQDGRPDLLVANEYVDGSNLSNGTVGVLLGKGDGTFYVPVAYPSGGKYADSMAVGDINADGKVDLLLANQCADSSCTSGSLSVLLGNGDGTFQPAITTSTPQIGGGTLALADFDGDGKLDVASGSGDLLLLGNGDGTFQSPLLLGAGGPGIAVGDFNLDGKPDLAVGGVTVLLNITGKSATTTTLLSLPQPSTYGQDVMFTATVTAPGTGSPTGVVSFADGVAILGTALVTSGRAVLSISALAAGTHRITASYSGDSNFRPSASSPLMQTVNLATTTTALASSANPSYLNQMVTFTATVASQYGGPVTGSVTFKEGTTMAATIALANGQASYTRTYTTTGTRYMTAVYSGDANNQSSTSAVLKQAVNALPAVTTTKVTTSGSPSFINQLVTFTAIITSTYGPIPDGEIVTFYDGATAIGTSGTSSGVTTFSTSALTAKTHTIKASYPGDATFKASSGTVTQVVNLYPSTISTPTSTLNPSTYGQSLTLRATVTSSAPSAPTGTVTFKNGTTSIGMASLNTGGFAALTKSNLPAGADSITAVYNGDAETAKSSSAVLMQTVNRAVTSTTVTSSLNPSAVGQTVTFTAKVTSPTTVPTGTVTFMDDSTALATVNLASGKASYATTALSAGSHNMTAVYSGTVSIVGSTSPILVQTVH